MVCRADQTCQIQFSPLFGAKYKLLSNDKYVLRASTRGKDLYDFIAEQCQLDPETFTLYLLTPEKMIDLSKMKDKTMSEVGVNFSFERESAELKHRLIVADSLDFIFQKLSEYGISIQTKATTGTTTTVTATTAAAAPPPPPIPAAAAPPPPAAAPPTVAPATVAPATVAPPAAAPTVAAPPAVTPPTVALPAAAPPAHHPPVWLEDNVNFKGLFKEETKGIYPYVGLVNQAMTCYLNSLLQALYMTPEFRNALYNWEYVDGSEKDEANSIPYQLQKLFLNLQTSTKSAVETTALTKSFGWDSTEAWQQHDIQELCRVMFDALEQKFKNTEQADLINRLYEGKMIDYVKCLECGTEKTREDTFLDIPLPVRPFGSSVTYNSVEEAMRAFVQYETLEGANQYHCEKCNKKCDAHKGLKFTKFPYLLTLHLKRFDFDYKTFHRIKLNDKVTFPDVLNLNSFISSASNQESPGGEEDIGVGIKCDDSSTTDSGTLDDDCPPCENSLSNSNHSTNHDQDDDEGIDMSNGPSTSNCSTHNHENEKNRGNCAAAKGPYIYELFSIMIHSGSASGGHYYAFIKDFRTQEWVSFNDQNVTQITHDDIQKTYGGGPTRAYYSGAYSSSTNAYMLMYRQIDPARNALPMQVEDFPKHIQELLKKMKESEDNDRINREKQMSVPRLRIYCNHPTQGKLMDVTLYVMPDVIWSDVTEQAYNKFHLEKVVSLSQCRLVSYDHYNDLIECSYDGREQETLASIANDQYSLTFLLEIRRKDQKFETYLPGGVMTKVFVIDVPAEDLVEGPISVRGLLTQTVREYKQMIGKIINMDPEKMKLVLRNYSAETRLLEKDDNDLETEEFCNSCKVLVATMLDTDSSKPFHESALYEIAETCTLVISLQIQLPDTSKEILEDLNIPQLEEKNKDKEKPVVNGPSKLTVSDSSRDVSSKCNDVGKTARSSDDALVRNMSPQLVEGEEWNTPEQSNSEDSSLSDSDKTLVGDVPEDDDFHLQYLPPSKTDNRTTDVLNQTGIENWDVDDNSVYYFKATPQPSNDKLLKVIVDKRMKLSSLKKSLEPYVGVSAEYFKVFQHSVESGETECSCLTEQLSSYEDGERLTIKLGRALRTGEFKIKLYQLIIDSAEPYKFLCEWIVSKNMTVGQAKKEILAELKRKYDIDIPYERCRLRNKYYRTASKVCLDDQTFEDIQFYSQFEMIIQELPDKEPVTDSNQVVLFVRRWSPSKMQLGPFQEIVLDEKSVEELGKKLSAISDIPEEYIDIARGKGGFPGETSVLRIQYDHDWSEHMVWFDDFSLPIGYGCVFLYRDNREKLKQLTHDEVKSLVLKESSPLIPLSTTLNYSPRRERALKIYLDTK